MPAICKSEAVERLGRAVETATSDDLVDIYAELFPDKERPSSDDAENRRGEIAEYVRRKMEPEELVDLWNVVYPAHKNVYYDDADGLLCYNQEEPWYVEG